MKHPCNIFSLFVWEGQKWPKCQKGWNMFFHMENVKFGKFSFFPSCKLLNLDWKVREKNFNPYQMRRLKKKSDLKYFLRLNSFSWFYIPVFFPPQLHLSKRSTKVTKTLKVPTLQEKKNGIWNEIDNYGDEWFYMVRFKKGVFILPLLK